MSEVCYLCKGDGGWTDAIAQQSVACPVCCVAEAGLQASRLLEFGWYPSAWPQMPARYSDGPRFQIEPWLIVIHSGARAPGVAEFMRDTGIVVYRGKRVKVNAHFCWSVEQGCYVQQVRLDTVGKHCGGATYKGQGKLNFCSIGVEMPGPAAGPRTSDQGDALRGLLKQLLNVRPSLRVCARHSDIDKRKADPGRGFRWAWLDGLRIELPFAGP